MDRCGSPVLRRRRHNRLVQLDLWGKPCPRAPRPPAFTSPRPLPPPLPAFDPEAVTADDLRFLSDPDPDSETGYRGVYPRPERATVTYVAKAFKRPVGPVCRTPREAARLLAAWWRFRYGPEWQRFWRGKGLPAVAYREDGGGWRATAFVLGRPVFVGAGQLGGWWATFEGARAGVERWRRDVFGLFEPVACLYLRAVPPVRVPRRGR